MARQQSSETAPEKGTDKPSETAPENGTRLQAGSVRIRTEHPRRFNHVACYGLTFGPVPRTFAPGELSADALERLKLDPLLVVEEG